VLSATLTSLLEAPVLDHAVKDIATKAVVDLLGIENNTTTELLAAKLPDMLLRADTVSAIVGLSVPTLYRLMAQGEFPRPIRLTGHARAWRLSTVMKWIDARAQDRTETLADGSYK
jgi:prophage regulatory protein